MTHDVFRLYAFSHFSFDFVPLENWFETWFPERSLNFLSKHTCFNCVKQWSQAEIGVIRRKPSITLKRKNLKRFLNDLCTDAFVSENAMKINDWLKNMWEKNGNANHLDFEMLFQIKHQILTTLVNSCDTNNRNNRLTLTHSLSASDSVCDVSTHG